MYCPGAAKGKRGGAATHPFQERRKKRLGPGAARGAKEALQSPPPIHRTDREHVYNRTHAVL
jgi:hypothetical protein